MSCFFYFECRQENGEHKPNLCIIHNEAGDEWVFEGDNTQKDFCKWLFSKEHKNCIVMAHNFQGYDSYFILQYLRQNGVKYDVIMRGAKVLTLSVPMFKIKFIDSLSFIPMKLANFPKTFGLTELAKGYFPHLFNKKENEHYIGPLPQSPYYHPDGMSPDEKEKFLKWHQELKGNNYVFDFQQEILNYCRSDVDILRRCCLEFRKLFCDVTAIDPFEKCLTIASITLRRIPSPLFHHTVTVRKTNSPFWRRNGYLTPRKRIRFTYNMHAMVGKNVLVLICWMVIMKKPIPPMKFKDVFGMVSCFVKSC
jgi:hypothetical protein